MSRYNTVLINCTSRNETFCNDVFGNPTLGITASIVSTGWCGSWASRHFLRTKCWVECCTGRHYGPMSTRHVSYSTRKYGAIRIRTPRIGVLGWSSWLSIAAALGSGFTRSMIDLSLCDTPRLETSVGS
jgi:hypothetical protein